MTNLAWIAGMWARGGTKLEWENSAEVGRREGLKTRNGGVITDTSNASVEAT